MEDLNSAVAAAVADVKTETSAPTATEVPAETPATEETAAAPETKTETKPAAETPAKEEDTEEEFYNPTSEELAAIEKSPELKKAYRALRKGFTAKTTELAQQRKAVKEQVALAQWIQENPEKAARTLAAHAGLSIQEAREQVSNQAAVTAAVDDLAARWEKTLGPAAASALRPLFEDTVRQLLNKEVEPIKAQTAHLSEAAQRRGIAASIAQFGAERTTAGDEWDDAIQQEMSKVIGRIQPGEETTIEEFLDDVYSRVMYARVRGKAARTNLDRLKRIRAEGEPSLPTRTAPAEEEKITSSMNDNDAVAMAVRQAKRDARQSQ